jgi:hypothetical protein
MINIIDGSVHAKVEQNQKKGKTSSYTKQNLFLIPEAEFQQCQKIRQTSFRQEMRDDLDKQMNISAKHY